MRCLADNGKCGRASLQSLLVATLVGLWRECLCSDVHTSMVVVDLGTGSQSRQKIVDSVTTAGSEYAVTFRVVTK